MDSRFFTLLAGFFLAVASPLTASILDMKELTIDFTNEKEVTEKAVWFPAEKVRVGPKGLGWDGEANASRDGWIHTKPLAVGLSWRAPSSVSVRVEIAPAPVEFTMSNGQKSTPWVGEAFARYSPDGVHWSSWQALARDEKKLEVRAFSGVLGVPQRERAAWRRHRGCGARHRP